MRHVNLLILFVLLMFPPGLSAIPLEQAPVGSAFVSFLTTSENEMTLFCSLNGQGIWGSIDGGETWTCYNDVLVDNLSQSGICDLQIADPFGEVIVAHLFAGVPSRYSQLITRDGGESWSLETHDFMRGSTDKLIISRYNWQHWFYFNGFQMVYSSDAGMTWDAYQIELFNDNQELISIVQSHNSELEFYALFRWSEYVGEPFLFHEHLLLAKSEDAGEHWGHGVPLANLNEMFDTPSLHGMDLQQLSNGDLLFVLFPADYSENIDNWSTDYLFRFSDDGNFLGRCGEEFGNVIVPTITAELADRPGTLYGTGNIVMVTHDYGLTWQPLPHPNGNDVTIIWPTSIMLSRNHTSLFLTNEQGFWKQNPITGNSITIALPELGMREELKETPCGLFAYGSRHLWRWNNSASCWEEIPACVEAEDTLAIDQYIIAASHDTLVAEASFQLLNPDVAPSDQFQHGLFHSYNEGESWIYQNTSDMYGFLADALETPDGLRVIQQSETRDSLLVSYDLCLSWPEAYLLPHVNLGYQSTTDILQTAEGYFAICSTYNSGSAILHYRTDLEQFAETGYAGVRGTRVNDAITSGNRIYTVDQQGCITFYDAGRWTTTGTSEASVSMKLSAIPGEVDQLIAYKQYSSNVYFSNDAGETWTQLEFDYEYPLDLENMIYQLVVDDLSDKVWLQTQYGLLNFELSVLSSPEQPVSLQADTFDLLHLYPNPFNGTGRVSIQLPRPEHVQLSLYDILGREVKTLLNQPMSAGVHSVSLDANQLPSGQYFLRLQGEEQQKTRKITLVK